VKRSARAALGALAALAVSAASTSAPAGGAALPGMPVDLAPAAAGPGPDCEGPAGDPPPDTPAWHQREQENDYCGEQRFWDTTTNPAYLAAKAALEARTGRETLEDPFRDPAQLDGVRFRFRQATFTNRGGQRLDAMLFRPCNRSCHDHPAALRTYRPPYPGVVIVHGGGASQEMYLWAAEGLAEAGYMVLTFQIPEPDNAGADTHYENAKDALDYFQSTPGHPTATGDVNPMWRDLARRHIGLAGHSAGGVAVSRLGQEDKRVSAIVSWDRAQHSPMPAGLGLRTPALFVVADFNCQQVPVCVPQPYTSPPDPRGPGNKDEDFRRLRMAGVDTMKVALRAATHLDFTQFSPGTGSRYGAVTAFYYTLAWLDRYVRGAMPGNRTLARGALQRLTATRFDHSADVHNISGGTYDAQTEQNVPAHIAGQPVADRLSFHFRSAYYIGHGRRRCKDIRAGRPAADPRDRRASGRTGR
jgi:dienelactone hydrolase